LRSLHSFPTRRSSDLLAMCGECQKIVDGFRAVKSAARALPPLQPRRDSWDRIERAIRSDRRARITPAWSWLAVAAAVLLATFIRSEEHTSELQSPYDL